MDAIECGVIMIGAGLVTLSNLLSTVVEVWPSRTLLHITIRIQNKLILSLFFSAFNLAIIDATDHNVNIHLFINVNVFYFYSLVNPFDSQSTHCTFTLNICSYSTPYSCQSSDRALDWSESKGTFSDSIAFIQ
jgi:hypothetical protein